MRKERVQRRARRILAVSCVLWAALARPGEAQVTHRVDGRVFDPEAGRGVQNAIVQIPGHRPALTGPDGSFGLPEIAPGTHTLRIEAFGYLPYSGSLEVFEDVSVTIGLEIAPFILDSLVVAPEDVDVRGTVHDLSRGIALKNADVFTSLGEVVRTNGRGRFDVDGWTGVGLLLQVRAFGYLPLDTIVVPASGERLVFDLEPDALVQKMIEVEIRRIEERAGGLRAIAMPAMNRDDLLRLRSLTLLEMLDFEYGRRAERLRCVVLDEESLTPATAEGVLSTTFPDDIERVEFLYGGAMLRIYTRDFMRRMLGSGIELRRPTYVDFANPPFCM